MDTKTKLIHALGECQIGLEELDDPYPDYEGQYKKNIPSVMIKMWDELSFEIKAALLIMAKKIHFGSN